MQFIEAAKDKWINLTNVDLYEILPGNYKTGGHVRLTFIGGETMELDRDQAAAVAKLLGIAFA